MSAPTKPRRVGRTEIVERRAKVLTMRNAGATWEKIAESFGVSVQCAKNDASRAIREFIRIPSEALVDRQAAVFRDILRVEYPALLDPSSPRHNDAVGHILSVLRDEAKLFGLNAPVKVHVGISEQEFAKQALDLLMVVGTGPLKELVKAAGPDVVDAEILEDEEDTPWSNL